MSAAIELLLALPIGRFTRQKVLCVTAYPVVVSRFPEGSTDE